MGIRINKKSALVTALALLVLLTLILTGVGCTSDGTDEGKAETETTQEESSPGMPPRMNWDEVAEILGIDVVEVEDAFIQVWYELAESDSLATRTKESPNGSFRNRVPQEGLPEGKEPPEGMRSSVGGRLPGLLLAKMEEILDIDQQDLELAFTQVQGESGSQ